MNSRERILAAVRRQVPDKVPVTLAYGHIDDLCLRRGKPGFVGTLRQDQRVVSFRSEQPDMARLAAYVPDPDPALRFNEWGIGEQRSSTNASASYLHPLGRVTTAAQVDAYPFPDLTQAWRHADLEQQVQALQAQGLAAVGQMSQTIFELAWLMRGMEALFVDMIENAGIAGALLDHITALRCYQARRFAEAGVDILRVGDDVGTQRGMMMSPATWRTWLKPRLGAVIESALAVRPDLPIKYHSDGDVTAIVPELIEVGVTILNPLQPEAMDPVALKGQFGDRLAFWGTIGTQTTLPFGTPDDVREAVRRMVATVGAGGGLVLAPTHSVEDDVPWENILAFYEAAETYGSYTEPRAA